MSFPIGIFTRVMAHEAPAGTMVFLRGGWAFRCDLAGTLGIVRQVFWLTGPDAGMIQGAPEESAMATIPEVAIDIRVGRPEAVKLSNGPRAKRAVISAQEGPELWGQVLGAPHAFYGFSLLGQQTAAPADYSFMCFDEFDIWLRLDGNDLGGEPLVKVTPP